MFSLGCRVKAAGVGATGFPCCPSARITGHDQCAAGTGCHQFLLADICLCTSTCLEDRAIWGKLSSPKPPENSGECSACSVGWTCPSLPYILHMQHVSLLTMQRPELAACSFRFAFCSHALFMSSFQLWSERPLSTGLGKLKHMQKSIACSHFFSFCSKPDDPITIILTVISMALTILCRMGRVLHSIFLYLWEAGSSRGTTSSFICSLSTALGYQVLENNCSKITLLWDWMGFSFLLDAPAKRWLMSTWFSFPMLQAGQMSVLISPPC